MDEPVTVEQTEKMIPLSAVAPILSWVAAKIRVDGSMSRSTLGDAWNHAAEELGLMCADEIAIPREHWFDHGSGHQWRVLTGELPWAKQD